MLRKSLSSDAAASLATALARHAVIAGSLGPLSNQMDACATPPCSFASSRMTRADVMCCPAAALAIVLEIIMAAWSSARGGKASPAVVVINWASVAAMVVMGSMLL